MFSPKKYLSLVLAASAFASMPLQGSAIAQDDYSGCSCISAPSSQVGGIGQIVASSGEVLVNNVQTAAGQILPASSEIMVGVGSVSYTVGSSCSNGVSNNTLVSISQPAGPGSNLCVKVSSIYADDTDSASLFLNGGSAPNAPLIIFGTLAGGAGIVALLDDERNPASP